MEPEPCHKCADHNCEDNPYNADQECWGTMSREERVELAQYLLAEKLANEGLSVLFPYRQT